MKMLFLVLLLLLNDKEGAHATQGKHACCVDMPSFLIVVVNGNRGSGRREAVDYKRGFIHFTRGTNHFMLLVMPVSKQLVGV